MAVWGASSQRGPGAEPPGLSIAAPRRCAARTHALDPPPMRVLYHLPLCPYSRKIRLVLLESAACRSSSSWKSRGTAGALTIWK